MRPHEKTAARKMFHSGEVGSGAERTFKGKYCRTTFEVPEIRRSSHPQVLVVHRPREHACGGEDDPVPLPPAIHATRVQLKAG